MNNMIKNNKLICSVFNTIYKSYSSSRIPLLNISYSCRYINSISNSAVLYFPKNKRNLIMISSTISSQSHLSSQADGGTASFEEVKNVCDGNIKDVLIIDVREPNELKESGILPRSLNIPLGEIESVLANVSNEAFLKKYGIRKPNKDSAIIFSCKSGKRSAMAQNISKQLGYVNIKNYAGGWLEWEERTK